jgi:hypothetical protein
MLYVIVDATTRVQKRVSAEPLFLMSASEALIEIVELNAEPVASEFRWDTATDSYVVQPSYNPGPYARTTLSRREFRARLGSACRVAINARLATPAENAGAVQLIAQLQDMKDELLSVNAVDIEHPTTIAAVNALMALGYLSAQLGAAALVPATVPEEA